MLDGAWGELERTIQFPTTISTTCSRRLTSTTTRRLPLWYERNIFLTLCHSWMIQELRLACRYLCKQFHIDIKTVNIFLCFQRIAGNLCRSSSSGSTCWRPTQTILELLILKNSNLQWSMHNECWKKLTKQIKFFFVISEWIDEDRVLFISFISLKEKHFLWWTEMC